jgi:ABC-type polysaccharide/polyol phosphate export permease
MPPGSLCPGSFLLVALGFLIVPFAFFRFSVCPSTRSILIYPRLLHLFARHFVLALFLVFLCTFIPQIRPFLKQIVGTLGFLDQAGVHRILINLVF